MELRKIIKFGKATYSITLPKQWVVNHKLKKGDVVRVEELSGGSLEVSPRTEGKEPDVKTIDIVAGNKNYQDIYREVVGAYIKNYTVINIVGDVSGKIKNLRSSMQELVGLEIMEVSPTKIVAKSFMDITETDVTHTLKRVFFIIKSMSEQFRKIVKEGGSMEEMIEMDREVNRNTFFTMKYLFKALEKPQLATKMGMQNYEILFTWEVVKTLENTADKIKAMAEIILENEVIRESCNKFMKVYDDIEKTFYFAMEEYFKKSKKNAHRMFIDIKDNYSKANTFMKENMEGMVPVLVDHLTDINMFIQEIAEIIVDQEG